MNGATFVVRAGHHPSGVLLKTGLRGRRSGFSMIEIMVATALSLMIILMVTQAFRAASSAIAAIRRASLEAAWVGMGFRQAMLDADEWATHADVAWPQAKGYLSLAQPDAASGDQSPRFRPFAYTHQHKSSWTPMRIAVSEPTALLPNDPAAWYRGGVLSNIWQESYIYKAIGSSATDITGTAAETTFGFDPIHKKALDCQPWNYLGSLASFSHVDMLESLDNDDLGKIRQRADRMEISVPNFRGGLWRPSEDQEELNVIAGLKPLQTWIQFRRLGGYGLTHYVAEGSPLLIMRPADHQSINCSGIASIDTTSLGSATGWYIGIDARNYDKGEMPWSLTPPRLIAPINPQASVSKSNPNTTIQVGSLDPDVKRLPLDLSSAWGNDRVELSRRNIAAALPALPPSEVDIDLVFTVHVTDAGLNFSNNFITNIEEQIWTGTGGVAVCDAASREMATVMPVSVVYPGFVHRRPNGTALTHRLDQLGVRPWRIMQFEAHLNGTNEALMTMAQSYQSAYLRTLYEARRYLHPSGWSDDSRAGISVPEGDGVRVEMGVFRSRHGRAERARYRLTLMRAGGMGLEIAFHVPGTDLRGARMLWGCRTEALPFSLRAGEGTVEP